MDFKIVRSNIINVIADAIVLPANSTLKEGSGVSAAIFQAAGRRKLKQECKKIGFCEVGLAVPTKAYNLGAKTIIHAVVPKWIDGNHNEYSLLSSAYLTSLQLADCMECSSIAFPLLASGNNGYDPELAFEIAKESINSFEGDHLEKVLIVILGSHIASMIDEQGYTIDAIPERLVKNVLKSDDVDEDKENGLIAEGKEVAKQLLEQAIQRATEYLKDENNQKQLIDKGAEIVKKALAVQKTEKEEHKQKGKKKKTIDESSKK